MFGAKLVWENARFLTEQRRGVKEYFPEIHCRSSVATKTGFNPPRWMQEAAPRELQTAQKE